jgi:hypothetical protein
MEVQHTYRIRHKGIESTPFTISDLRHMWKASQIDATTEFRRGDSPVWLDANDLRMELERADEQPAPAEGAKDQLRIYPALRDGVPVAPGCVRVTSVKVPFREVFVLVFKFYLAAILLAALATTAWLLALRFLR